MRLKLKDWPASEVISLRVGGVCSARFKKQNYLCTFSSFFSPCVIVPHLPFNHQAFAKKLPKHFEDFMAALPFSEYVRPDGLLNLISALPEQANKPDLGPKCYIAYEETATSLHFDMSDAINLLVHVGTLPPTNVAPAIPETAGALWHIFRREDVPQLSVYLKELKGRDGGEHAIFDHSVYITDAMLATLKEQYNVAPFAFYQNVGDSVFIPAGCPHQVKNVRPCIKIAEDFVSPENLVHCIRLTDEFRKLPYNHKFRKDRLQVRTILYHAVEKAVNSLL